MVVVFLVLVLLPTRSAWIAGGAIVTVVVTAAWLSVQPLRHKAAITSLEERYQHAVDDGRHWLTTWGELRAMRTEIVQHDERLLLDEALDAAEDAAAEAIGRRDRFASRFIANGFERLDYLIASGEATHDAIAVIERYLDTLWLDHEIAGRARVRLQAGRPSLQQQRLVQTVGSITLLESSAVAIGGDLDTHRFRLRAERRLLNESPLADIDSFHDL